MHIRAKVTNWKLQKRTYIPHAFPARIFLFHIYSAFFLHHTLLKMHISLIYMCIQNGIICFRFRCHQYKTQPHTNEPHN